MLGMCEEANAAIFNALREAKWPKLENLLIGGPNMPDEWVFQLAGILEGGAGGNLRSLRLYCPPDESLRELGRVLRDGACPKLRSLRILPPLLSMEKEVRALLQERCFTTIKEVGALLKERYIRTNRD